MALSCLAPRATLAAVPLLAVLAAVAGGCGGGGSSPAGGDGGFTASPSTLSFDATWLGTIPPGRTVTMRVTNGAAVYVGAAWSNGDPGWITLSSISGSNGTYYIGVSVNDTGARGLAPGTHNARLTLGIGASDQTVLATQDVAITYVVHPVLRVTESAVAWSWVEGAASTASSLLHIQGPGLTWTASADQPWIQLGATSGGTPATLAVSANALGLARGTHHGTLTLTPSAGAAPVQLPVDLTVVAPRLLANAAALAFSGTNGAELPAQSLAVRLSSDAAQAWSATSSAAWLVLDHASGLTPDTIGVHVDPSQGPLASGSYEASLTLSATVGPEVLTTTVAVRLGLSPAILAVTPGSLALGGASGRDLSGKSLQVSLDTGARTHPYAVGTSAGWLVASPASGLAYGTPQVVAVAPDTSGLAGGQYTGKVTVSAQVNGDLLSVDVPVALGLDRHLVLASAQGVALASIPGPSSTSRTLRVRDNFGYATSFTANSSRPWLSVTPSGTTPADLVLTADPTGLATNTVHVAQVTVHAADASVERDETIEVGLWVGAAMPAAVITAPAATWRAVAADPVRPYAYAHAGSTAITVFNVYTGEVARTYPGIAARLGEMVVSADGKTLFAQDLTNVAVVPLDLASGTVGTAWPLGSSGGRLAYGRTNGKGLVHAGSACAFDADSGAKLTSTSCWQIPGVSRDGTRMCWSGSGYTPADAWCAPLDYSSAGGGTVLVGASAHTTLSGSQYQVSLNADGTRAYFANGGGYRVFDAATLAGLQTLQWAPVDVAWDGRILSYRWDDDDLEVFAANGADLGSCGVGVGGGYDSPFRTAVFSGDGLRAVVAYYSWSNPAASVLRFARATF